MEMETVSLSRIVLRFKPELYSSLKRDELDARIVLRDGMERLTPDDAWEIIRYSISEYQKNALLH